ncbi:helix-turn-helix domain-containing protein [Nonomuraea sp. NPDC049141]|uniref:PucR family transcriptional regulator n=1 Tax=Nonomuraea sp. NPDC049141 TaxID=3155500 RepID=UPI0033E3C473
MNGPGAVGAAGWEAPVTVAELVNAGPLAGARMYGSGLNPVHQVRIVEELAMLSGVGPHTAVVLIGAAARGGWAVEMAMRRAWEQAAACVIAPASAVGAGSGEVLAERLGVTLIFVEEDPLVTAVRVASAAARPQAARTQLVARCATRLAEAGTSARRVLGVLNAELPGTSVALAGPDGGLLAGRRAAQERPLAEVEVPGPAGTVLGRLLAAGPSRSPGWAPVVTTVLKLAVAPLTAWAATERLRAAGSFAWQQSLAERLLTETTPTAQEPPPTGSVVRNSNTAVRDSDTAVRDSSAAARNGDTAARDGNAALRDSDTALRDGDTALRDGDTALRDGGTALRDGGTWAGGEEDGEAGSDILRRAAALGWATRGPLAAFVIQPRPFDDATVLAVLSATLGPVPVLRHGQGWAGWTALPPDRLANALADALTALPKLCSAGIGSPAGDLAGLGESLLGAHAAALVAQPGTVARADRMGPAELLAALPAGTLGPPAEVVLRPLLAADRDGTLVRTLAAVLGEGGPLRAAEALGVHRNTVTTRLDRIRAAGYDLDDPATRLALHLAVHLRQA